MRVEDMKAKPRVILSTVNPKTLAPTRMRSLSSSCRAKNFADSRNCCSKHSVLTPCPLTACTHGCRVLEHRFYGIMGFTVA